MSKTREEIGTILQQLANELAPDIQAGYLLVYVKIVEAIVEKRVKAARLGELKNVRELIMELDEGPFVAVAELIAELESQ